MSALAVPYTIELEPDRIKPRPSVVVALADLDVEGVELLLRAEPSVARHALKALLTGRLTFAPGAQDGVRCYSFEASGTVAPVIGPVLQRVSKGGQSVTVSDPAVDRLDHLVLTVRDIDATCRFYTSVLGMRVERFGEGRVALHFGRQKINVHPIGGASPLVAAQPTPGSGDLCFLSDTPLARWLDHLKARGVAIIEGPSRRTGAQGPIDSVYFRDPDGNLVEVSNAAH